MCLGGVGTVSGQQLSSVPPASASCPYAPAPPPHPPAYLTAYRTLRAWLPVQEHLSLLSADGPLVRAQVLAGRGSMERREWISCVRRFQGQAAAVRTQLPDEARIGLYHVDCR